MIPRHQTAIFLSVDCWRFWIVWIAFGTWNGLGNEISAQAQKPAARFVQEVPGGGKGLLIKCDLQHRFSDEDLLVAQFVTQAVDNGCQAVFVSPPKSTNHPDRLAQFLREVEIARQVFPNVIILPAYPWMIRTGGFVDEAMIVLPPGDNFPARFVSLAERLNPPAANAPLSESAGLVLQALCPVDLLPAQWPAVIFNERSEGTAVHRWAVERFPPNALWSLGKEHTPSQRVFGQTGLLDRWDQMELYAGGEWDQLLADGWNAWAASGGIDILNHARAQAFKPGAFTETWVMVPEFTADHVVQAVKHGAFFGVRGKAAREVDLKLTAPGLSRTANPGETVDLPVGTPIRLVLSLLVPDRDWRKTPHRLDGIELIAVTPEQSRIVKKESGGSGRIVIEYETEVPEGGILFRAIGYREVKDSPDYGFYTNPIRVIASGQWVRPVVVANSESWLKDESGFLVVGMTLVFAVCVVAGWLAYSGKFQLLFGDVFAPVRKRWKSSKLRRILLRYFPGLSRHGETDRTTVGTALSETECHRLAATLIVSTVVLGGQCGWASGVWGGTLAGAVLGALWGGVLRSHAVLGLWLFLLVKFAANLWPGAFPAPWDSACLSAALIGFFFYEALRTGTLRWPATSPVNGLIGLAAILVTTPLLGGVFPGWLGSLAQLTGICAAAGWSCGNLEWGRIPLRGLAVLFVTALWFGLLLTQGCPTGHVGALPCIIGMLAEAIGVGLLYFVCRPERLDAIGLILSQAALAAVALLISPESPGVLTQLAAGAAGIGVLLCFVADVPCLAALSAGMTALVLGRWMLFSPMLPGAWLVGTATCLATCLVARCRIRLALFLLPYLVISGYGLCIVAGNGPAIERLSSAPLETVFRRELTPLQQAAEENPPGTMRTSGQMISVFCLVGLTVLYFSIRQKHRHDIFDAAGRGIGATLVISGMLSVLGFPMHGAGGFMLASLAGLWAAQIRQEDLVATNSWNNAVSEGRILNAFRRRLGVAGLVAAALIAYGSLVPFQWREITGWEAVQQFLAQFQYHYARGQLLFGHLNSDRLVNVLLTVPLAFLVYGSMVLGRRGVASRIWAIFEAWQMSLAFSFLVELAQEWSIGRVASVQDVVAQGIGAGLGIGLWIVLGEWFVLRLAATAQERTAEGRWGQLLAPYLFGVLIFAVLPAGLPVTSPKQLFDHYRDGQLCWTPFSDCPTWGDVLRDAVAGLVLFFPVGIWGSMAFRRPGQELRSIVSSTANGVAFAALVTVLRGLCSAKMTDSSWLLTGAAGSALGAVALHAYVNTESDRYASWRTGLGWWIGSLAFGAIITGFFLHPWVFDASVEEVANGWKHFVSTPFARFHSGNDWLLIEEVVRKLAWFVGWGLLLGQAVVRSSESRLGKLIGGLFAVALTVATGLAIEICQLYQTHHSGEITDVIIYASGALAGLWLRWSWLGTQTTEGLPFRSYSPTSVIETTKSWLSILQTTIAIGLAIGLLLGLVVLAMRQ